MTSSAKIDKTVPRGALIWLLIAQFFVILPHLNHLPYWEVGLWAGCALWRIQVFRMRAAFPSVSIKAVLLVAAIVGTFLSRGALYALDGATAFLVVTFVLKVLELRKPHDALTIIYLGFFVVMTRFLFDSEVVTALLCLPAIISLLTALVALQMGDMPGGLKVPLWKSGRLLLEALPLTLIVFLVFPRVDPFWHLPQARQKAQSGLSDNMSPGDIAELGNSSELVFRASFKGPIPARPQLYWRAFTLDRFDGRAWTQAVMPARRGQPTWDKRGDPLDYSVIMEASGHSWLYVLDVAEPVGKTPGMPDDFRLQRDYPVDQTYQYNLRSWPQAVMEPEGHNWAVRRALLLPQRGNERSRAWARELAQRHRDPQELVATVLRQFKEQPFIYTLKPPPLGADSVDDFLFRTRQGFCEHYASAMTFVLRAAGIPARVVVGYQGGEIALSGGYLQMRQYDAHTWVEYWTPGQGWQRADPTFQVSPDRIRLGAAEVLEKQAGFLGDSRFSLLRYRHLGWVNRLRSAWDDVNYGWQHFVLGYQIDEQKDFLGRLFGGGKDIARQLMVALVLIMVLVGSIAALLLARRSQRLDKDARLYQQFESMLARRGVVRVPGEGPRDFAGRASRELPKQQADILEFAKGFEALRYAGQPVPRTRLKRLLWRLRFRLMG